MTVPLKDIRIDGGTQVRAAINEQVVAAYAERMEAGDVFPAVVLFHDGNGYFMADGFHRGLAATRIGKTTIPAEVKPGTQADALWYALGANRTNAHEMTTADKRHAILLAVGAWPDKSGRQIAEQIGCSPMWVSMVKAESGVNHFTPDARVIGKDGKSYPATTKRRRDEAVIVPVAPSVVTTRQPKVDLSMPTDYAMKKAMAIDGASVGLLKKLPRRADAAQVQAAVHALQGIVSVMAQINAADLADHPEAVRWHRAISDVIGVLRAFVRPLPQTEKKEIA